VQIGDNAVADVGGARAVRMHGILIDRRGRASGADYPIIRALAEAPGAVAGLA
jgi:FMN phosphatase YigB (HAD superfamily)